jgi:hypothetical protein
MTSARCIGSSDSPSEYIAYTGRSYERDRYVFFLSSPRALKACLTCSLGHETDELI